MAKGALRERDVALALRIRDLARPPVVLMGHLNLIRAFGLASVPIVLVTTDPRDEARLSRYVRGTCVVAGFVEEGDASSSLRVLLRAGALLSERFGVRPPLLFGSDERLAFVQRFREPLGACFALMLNDDALAAALLDKSRFAELCREKDLPVPRSARLERACDELRFPLVVKPRLKTEFHELRREVLGEGKARIFETHKQMRSSPDLWEHADELFAQEYIPGDDDRLYSLHGFADAGRLIAAFVGRKIRTYPRLRGESSYIELIKDQAVLRLGEEVSSQLGLSGAFKIDFKRDARDDRDYVLEINARLTLWAYLGAVSGINLPAIAYEYMLAGRLPEGPLNYRTDRRWVYAPLDLQAIRERGGAAARWIGWAGTVLSPRTVHGVFAWRDPLPWAFALARQGVRQILK